MDQIKIGKFIADLRKERGLTQRELADLLLISDKTVSKWERGSGLPEVSLMIPLCNELGITVNELLTGKRLFASEYQQNAEKTIMKLMKEREQSKQKLVWQIVIMLMAMLGAFTLIMVSGLAQMPDGWRVALIIIGFVVLVTGLVVVISIEMTYGAFECTKCGHRFMPTTTEYLFAVHTATRRYLKCPKCGKNNWTKRCLTVEPDEENEK